MHLVGLVVPVGDLAGTAPAALGVDPAFAIEPIDAPDGAMKTPRRPIIFAHRYEETSARNGNGWVLDRSAVLLDATLTSAIIWAYSWVVRPMP
jgi:hypothetical protein